MAKYPAKLPRNLRKYWRKPWSWRARRSKKFRYWLDKNGYLSPNFKKKEAACKDGTPVPRSLEKKARDHAFNLERLRHAIGDRPVRILSWYRTPSYNKKVGGASQSQHMQACATDHSQQWVAGIKNFDRIANRVFRRGGFGQYPGGSRHLDSRGRRARWTSY